jgi:hypothetical protein
MPISGAFGIQLLLLGEGERPFMRKAIRYGGEDLEKLIAETAL